MSAPKISLALGAKRQAPSTTNGVKRPRAALQEDEDDGVEVGRTESVSHFDKTAGGAIDSSRKQETQGPLVIPRQVNRNWKEAANQRKRQKSGLPEGAGGGREGLDRRVAAVEAELEAAKPKFGLNTYDKPVVGDADVASEAMGIAHEAQQLPPEPTPDAEPLRKQTDEERALDALMGKTTTDKTLVIQASNPLSEEDAFNNDIASAPPMPSMDDYARVPVEQFGAALLRGMGWKDGEGVGSQRGIKLKKESVKPPAKRSNLLGIGAKEDAAIAGEMGAWGRGAKGKEVKIYNPVLLKDTKTGEMFTEEELKAKAERDEKAKYEREWERKEKEKRGGRGDRSGGDDRRRDRDGDSREHRHEKDHGGDDGRRRDRNHSRDRDRRKYDDNGSDAEYRRRKEKERHRRQDPERDARNGGDKHRRRGDNDRDDERRRHRDHDDGGRRRDDDSRRERDRGHRR
ncbi:uncharacterized protein RCC_04030 [Ramularia collo-cygni]|uniref:Pre-mRNA-splicing factor n=1 Tax=Ramularia collo-cygni TaxID=112498 RepID=A0A2D3UYB6_9PEZI|nr:uncharacterized protein RCC_04030 [Ramularia collo-cygni]CZT18190.1 uncharacterized protein RCC_04030 [Ramularia collo-cygni]